jgi:hypothetical protein
MIAMPVAPVMSVTTWWLQIHLRQRLLHVLDVRGGVIQQTFTLAQTDPGRATAPRVSAPHLLPSTDEKVSVPAI